MRTRVLLDLPKFPEAELVGIDAQKDLRELTLSTVCRIGVDTAPGEVLAVKFPLVSPQPGRVHPAQRIEKIGMTPIGLQNKRFARQQVQKCLDARGTAEE